MAVDMAKARIRQNAWDNWYGYLGRKRVMAFGNSREETAEQAAQRWLAEQTPQPKDVDKPYCGNCGAQGVPLRKLPYRGCDDPQHICKDQTACRERRKLPLGERSVRICATCNARVKTRAQWLAEKCPAAKDGKSGHLISKPGLLKEK